MPETRGKSLEELNDENREEDNPMSDKFQAKSKSSSQIFVDQWKQASPLRSKSVTPTSDASPPPEKASQASSDVVQDTI